MEGILYIEQGTQHHFSSVHDLNIFLRVRRMSSYLQRKCTQAEIDSIREQYFAEKEQEHEH